MEVTTHLEDCILSVSNVLSKNECESLIDMGRKSLDSNHHLCPGEDMVELGEKVRELVNFMYGIAMRVKNYQTNFGIELKNLYQKICTV